MNGKARFTTRDLNRDSTISIELNLSKLKQGTPYYLIDFEFNSSDNDTAEMGYLFELKEVLQDNPSIEIEVGGHRTTNEKTEISLQRANKIKEILVSIGVDSTQAKTKDYGATKQIRQVDFKVVRTELNK